MRHVTMDSMNMSYRHTQLIIILSNITLNTLNCDDRIKFGQQISNAHRIGYKHNKWDFSIDVSCHNDKIKIQLNCFVLKMNMVRKTCKKFPQKRRLRPAERITTESLSRMRTSPNDLKKKIRHSRNDLHTAKTSSIVPMNSRPGLPSVYR